LRRSLTGVLTRLRGLLTVTVAVAVALVPLGAEGADLAPTTTPLTGASPTTHAAVDTAASKPLAGIVIALDPGHNGGNSTHLKQINRKVWIGNKWKACNTVGTSTNAGYAEHRFTWALAKKVKARLVALGATVKMTRTNDTGWGPCSTTRGRFGAKVHADLTVSLHGDGLASSAHGFVVIRPGLVKGYTNDILARSKTLAYAIRAGLTRWHSSRSTAYGGDGLDVRTDLGTLNLSNVPVVLVELGNMRNAHDASLMSSSTGQSRYANGLVSGIRSFLHR
jgi:N-acetylmuramoyl-L-alanine amidase